MSLASVIDRSKGERESWRYTDVNALLARAVTVEKKAVTPKIKPILQGPCLIFVNGVLRLEQSQLGDLPANIIQGDAANGYHLALAGQTCLITSPVELLFLTTDEAKENNTKLHIELGQSGRLTLIERHEAAEGAAAHIIESSIALHPQAKLVHKKMVKSNATSVHLAMTNVHIAEGAFYDNFALIMGGKLTRNEIDATLAGKLAQCALKGAMLLRGREHADTTTRITHAAPHGTSREMYKTVVAEQARGVFQGKIVVAEGAQKTDGHQLSRALLLSDQAEMDAKPELEIYADDVRCSHGSTVGDLDEDALFYLRARGLSTAEARALLIQGFVGEILDEIHMPEWRDFCRTEVEGWLHEQN